MNPIKLKVMKATTVPTKYQAKHKFRTDWKLQKNIDYSESSYYFSKIGGETSVLNIQYDSQIAKWLLDTFGVGRYQLHVWKKGVVGFRFFSFTCNKDNFIQNQVTKKKSLLNRYHFLKRKLKNQKDKNIIEKINEKMEDIEFELQIDKETLEENEERRGIKKIRFFDNTSSLGKLNDYMNYGVKNNNSKDLQLPLNIIKREGGFL